MSAARVMKETGCGAIKPRGAAAAWRRPSPFWSSAGGFPVMGHIGLTPQSINTIGSFPWRRGRTEADWAPIEGRTRAPGHAGREPSAVGDRGGWAEPLARRITACGSTSPPSAIGGSVACDGQNSRARGHARASRRGVPRFRQAVYAEMGSSIEAAVAAYAGPMSAPALFPPAPSTSIRSGPSLNS